MRYFKSLSDGYIYAIGTGPGGTEITEAEYKSIKSVIANMPKAESGYWYKLTDNLTWEMYKIITPAPEPTTEERIAALEKDNAELRESLNALLTGVTS